MIDDIVVDYLKEKQEMHYSMIIYFLKGITWDDTPDEPLLQCKPFLYLPRIGETIIYKGEFLTVRNIYHHMEEDESVSDITICVSK